MKVYITNVFYLPMLIIGLMMLFFPQFTIDIFNITIAILLIFNGIKYLVEEYYLKTSHNSLNHTVMGVINIGLGLILITSDISLVNILPIAIAIFLFSYVLAMVVALLRSTNLRSHRSVKRIISASLAFILAVLLLTYASSFSRFIIQVLGLILIVIILNVNFELYRLNKVPFVKRIKRKKKD